MDTTVPLLTPTMESELLKEPWVFPQPKTNITREEEKAASSIWEENFQDLSVWCMDTFQGQCDYHTGESAAFKLSGTKYEGNSVLSSEEGVLKDLMRVTDEEKWSMKMTTAETIETMNNNNNCNSLQSPSASAINKYEKNDSTVESNASSNIWLRLPKGSTSTPVVNSSTWSKQQTNTDVVGSTPFQSSSCHATDDVDLYDACPTTFDTTANQRETWDMLRTVETTGSDTFDLLSYVCDDEMRSPEGSVSVDSPIILKPWSSPPTTTTTPTTLTTKTSATIPERSSNNSGSSSSVKIKTERSNDSVVGPECRKTRGASTITSSSVETPVVTTRRTERIRTPIISGKVEKTYGKVRREKTGRKRSVDPPELDDRTFASHYRESREKNNEASRKSRMNKKAKETEMARKAIDLEKDNRILKMKVEELEKLVTSMRSALLRSALKKEF